MSIERYPANLVVGLEDFNSCGWETILTGIEREDYPAKWEAFLSAARQAIEEGRQKQGKVLWLLADACSMMLSPKSINKPFKPIVEMDGKRTALPEDFSDDDIQFFSLIVEGIDDIWLKARLADLVWLNKRSLGIKFALMAIDSYLSIPLDTKTFIRGGRACWERAIGLTRMLGGGAGERMHEIEVNILGVFYATSRENGFFALQLADMLYEYYRSRENGTKVAEKLKSLAQEFEFENDLHSVREYFRASADWFKLAGDEDNRAEMTVCFAESLVKEAAANISSDQPSHMSAVSIYEKAIQVYRTIPHSKRGAHRANERIAELSEYLKESGEKSLDEMVSISTPGIDISQIVESSKNLVSNKSPLEALKAFANLRPIVRVEELCENTIVRLKQNPLHAFVQASFISHDGRVIAKRPGMNTSGDSYDKDENFIYSEMISYHLMLVGIIVQSGILPALDTLLLEHRFAEADFIYLSSQTPIVPMGRERLFGKALFSGYDKDFVTAIHLLVPQIEHMVRYHLKSKGVKTTKLDSNGIENENGLSSLMDIPETKQIFGEDLSFEIKALFCDPFGPNLRNELAHGLMDDEACKSSSAIYAWWLAFKLIFNSFWITTNQDSQNVSDSQK